MPFQKGNKLGQSTKGDIRLKPSEWENFGEWLIKGGVERLHQEMSTLEGKDFIQGFTSILEYFKPKLGRIETKDITPKDDVPTTPAERKQYVNGLLDKLNEANREAKGV